MKTTPGCTYAFRLNNFFSTFIRRDGTRTHINKERHTLLMYACSCTISSNKGAEEVVNPRPAGGGGGGKGPPCGFSQIAPEVLGILL